MQLILYTLLGFLVLMALAFVVVFTFDIIEKHKETVIQLFSILMVISIVVCASYFIGQSLMDILN